MTGPHGATVAGFVVRAAVFSTVTRGMAVAITHRMAAVFALVFLFVVASIGFMFKALPGASFGTIAAMLTFCAMGAGLFLGLLKLARGWENEAPTGE